MEWISVKDALPRNSLRVLVSYEEGSIFIGQREKDSCCKENRCACFFIAGCVKHLDGIFTTKVTGWMFLPSKKKDD